MADFFFLDKQKKKKQTYYRSAKCTKEKVYNLYLHCIHFLLKKKRGGGWQLSPSLIMITFFPSYLLQKEAGPPWFGFSPPLPPPSLWQEAPKAALNH